MWRRNLRLGSHGVVAVKEVDKEPAVSGEKASSTKKKRKAKARKKATKKLKKSDDEEWLQGSELESDNDETEKENAEPVLTVSIFYLF